MKNKKWLLLLIIAFPSLFWLILETSTINSRKLPYYGHKVIRASGDTVYQEVNSSFYRTNQEDSILSPPIVLSKDSFGVFALIILHEKYRKDAFRITGLSEYLSYKKNKIEPIPIVILTPCSGNHSAIQNELKQLKIHKNLQFLNWPVSGYDSLVTAYFRDKPYYIDYSFFILIDQNRNIRGYYDMRYVAEMKRLVEEYQHLRLKEEKQKMIKTNEIESNS